MRYFLLFVISAFFFLPPHLVLAQQPIGIHVADTPHSLAIQSFQQDRLGEACTAFSQYQEKLRDKLDIHLLPEQQEGIFYALQCGLRLAHAQAAQDALQFLAGSPLQAYQDRLHASLADYYFRTGEWAACLYHFSRAGITHFSNGEIAAAQFQQGYAHFVLQQYNEAKAHFNSVRSLPQGLYKNDATYYYALLLIKERNFEEALLQLRLVEFDSAYGSYVPYYIAQLLLSKGQRSEAVDYVLERLQKTPAPYHQKELQLLLGQSYFLQEKYQQALVHLRVYEAKTDTIAREDNYLIAYSQCQTGNISDALPRLRLLSAKNDSLGQCSMFLLGDAYVKLGDLANARSAFLFCSRNSVDEGQREASRFFYAKLSYQLGLLDESLSGVQSFIAAYPSSTFLAEAKELQLSVLAATSNYKEALLILDQLTNPSEPARRLFSPILYGRAAELINDGELKAADALLDRALKDPNNISWLAYLFFWKGELAFRDQRYQEAIDYTGQYLQKGAPVQGEAQPQHARYTLGYAHLRLEQYDQALTFFKTISAQVGANTGLLGQDALIREADCLLMLKRYDQAGAVYKKVIDFAWKEADYALYQLAFISGIKNPEEKIRLLKSMETSYQGSPLLTASWMAIADTYMEDERFALAKPFLEKVIAKEKSMQLLPQARLKLGIAHYNSDNNKAALEQFNYVLDQFSNSEEAADALENIKSIYIEEGHSADFIGFVRSKGLSLSVTAEDSLRFSAAEQLYTNKLFDQALPALESYLSVTTQPSFSLDAYAMLATMAREKKDITKALLYYDSVLTVAPNRYAEEAALQAARISFFEQKNYERTVHYYGKLFELTGLSSSKLEALRGLLRAHYLLEQLDQAANWGAVLLNEKGSSTDDKALVALVAAKRFLLQSKEEEAQFSLRQVISLNKASLAAEARYELAASLFRKQQYAAAEKAAFETINRSGSYENWVTRSYLLLGDIYFAQRDYFNAKATYQSVNDNAGIEEFKKIAAEKLVLVQQAEAGKSIPQKDME
ncbi:MAG: tetratricopeptide repeat protein [Sphingomonadales bacterium]